MAELCMKYPIDTTIHHGGTDYKILGMKYTVTTGT